MAENRNCDIDDIICQIEVLTHLRGIKNRLGEESFRSNFPEFEGLEGKLTERIGNTDASLQQALERCGLPSLASLEGEGDGGTHIE